MRCEEVQRLVQTLMMLSRNAQLPQKGPCLYPAFDSSSSTIDARLVILQLALDHLIASSSPPCFPFFLNPPCLFRRVRFLVSRQRDKPNIIKLRHIIPRNILPSTPITPNPNPQIHTHILQTRARRETARLDLPVLTRARREDRIVPNAILQRALTQRIILPARSGKRIILA